MVYFLLLWGRSSAGRALEWHSRGHGFDPHRLHQKADIPSEGWCVCFFVLREAVRERTGRRTAVRKKGAGGTLFSPRVDPLK